VAVELTRGMHRRAVVGAALEDGDRAELPRRVHAILPPALLVLLLAELHGARVALAAVAPEPAELAATAPAGAGEAAAAGEVLPAQHPPHRPAAQHLAQRGPEAAGASDASAPPLLEPVVAEAEEPAARHPGCRAAASGSATSAAPGPTCSEGGLDEERLLLFLEQLREPPGRGHCVPPSEQRCRGKQLTKTASPVLLPVHRSLRESSARRCSWNRRWFARPGTRGREQ
jgi:hypothetical protein